MGHHHAGGGRVTPALSLTLVALAFCGAFVSGLVGVGGAIVMIPLLYHVPPLLGAGELAINEVAGLPAGPDDVLGLSAVTGSLGKAATGQVTLWPAAAVALGSLGGAPLGGRVSRRVPVAVRRGVLAGIITIVMLRVWLDVVAR